jgi:hypothetical protein
MYSTCHQSLGQSRNHTSTSMIAVNLYATGAFMSRLETYLTAIFGPYLPPSMLSLPEQHGR